MRQTIRTLGRLRADSIQPEARERLLDVFRDWNGLIAGGRSDRRWTPIVAMRSGAVF
jgi:hypothetical protein